MAAQVYLQLDGIKGSATDRKHAFEIEINHWSWPSTRSYFSNRSSADNTIYIEKFMDSSSVALLEHSLSRRRIPGGYLMIVTATDGFSEDSIKIRLLDVLIDSRTDHINGGIEELLVLKFGTFFAVYSERDTRGIPVEHTLLSNFLPFLDYSDYYSRMRREDSPWSGTPYR